MRRGRGLGDRGCGAVGDAVSTPDRDSEVGIWIVIGLTVALPFALLGLGAFLSWAMTP